MFRGVIAHFILLVILLAIQGTSIYAQAPTLPDIVAASDKGVNVLTWNCQYDGIKSIAVQRSTDSVVNYKTIGYVKNTKKGLQAFLDGHPDPGDNWYKLNIAFSSDLTWESNKIKVYIDSATLLSRGVIPPNDSLQKYATNVNIKPQDVIASSMATTKDINTSIQVNKPSIGDAPELDIDIPTSDANQMTYIKSQHVFTNPFTGHINVELPNDTRETFSLQFFTQDDLTTPVLDIPRLREKKVIIDKHNFQGKGVYKFILNRGHDLLDEGYISIY